MGAGFGPFLNSGFNFTILQSNRNFEYAIDKLQIWEMSLAKTLAPSFKDLPDRLSWRTVLFSSKSLRRFNTLSLDTKLNLNLKQGNLRIF